MEPFSFALARLDQVLVLRTDGYLDADAGKDLARAVEKGCAEGYQRFVFDFTRSPVINSQGTMKLLEITESIQDRRRGKVAFTGLSDIARTLFQMVGLLLRVQNHPDEETAVRSLSA